MIKKYRKKPIVIEAVAVKDITSLSDIWEWCGNRKVKKTKEGYLIKTLEGDMLAGKNDYIIKGINGEVYPCKPDIFHKTYEEVL